MSEPRVELGDAINDVLDVIDEHIPSLSDSDEDIIVSLAGDMGGFSDDEPDAADLAIRTCACGERIDGYYEYVSHLKASINKALR